MKFLGVIRHATCHHRNGKSTPKVLTLFVEHTLEDADGTFTNKEDFSVPCSFATPLGEHPELVGKAFSIEIFDPKELSKGV